MKWYSIFIFIFSVLAKDFEYEQELSREGIMFRPLLNGKISYSYAEIGFTYSLQPLYEDFTILGKNIDILKTKCQKLSAGNNCVQSLQHLNDRYKQIQILRGKYIPFISRKNRGLVDLNLNFGFNSGSDELAGQIEYSRKITLNTSSALQNYIEENGKALSNIEETIKNLTIDINAADRSLFRQSKRNSIEIQYLNIYQMISNSLYTHETMTNTIIDIVRDISFNDLMKIIDEDLIKQCYWELDNKIKSNEQLVPDIFHSLKTIKETVKFNVKINSNRLLINVIIPIARKDNFTFFQPISVPTQIGTDWFYIKPNYDFFIANDDFSIIIETSKSDFKSAITLQSGDALIFPENRIPINNQQSCESTILGNHTISDLTGKCSLRKVEKSNFIIQMYGLDVYFCAMLQPIIITSQCQDSKPNESVLPKSGFLILHPFCTYSLNNMIIQTSNRYLFNASKLIQPKVNLTKLIGHESSDSTPTEIHTIKTNSSLIENVKNMEQISIKLQEDRENITERHNRDMKQLFEFKNSFIFKLYENALYIIPLIIIFIVTVCCLRLGLNILKRIFCCSSSKNKN